MLKRILSPLLCLLFATAALAQTNTVPISQLPPAVTPFTGSEYVPIVQSGITRRGTVVSFLAPTVLSGALDAAFGSTPGTMISRGASAWQGIGPGTNAQLLFGQTGSVPAFLSVTGDCTLTSAGVMSCTTGGVSIAKYGAKCDGTTDDTAAIQAAWNFAASVGKKVYLSGVGIQNCKFSTLTAPAPTTGEVGNRAPLVGDGSGTTKLTSTVTGSSCAITIAPTGFGTNSDYNATFSGFTLVNAASPSPNGKGICMTNVTEINFNDIWIQSFVDGVFAADSLRITWTNSWFIGNTNGVHTTFITNTHPNAWVFINPVVAANTGYGMLFLNSTDINIFGGDWENNGIGNASAIALYMLGNPIDGTKGLNLNGGYFSGNNGLADVYIDTTNNSALSGAHAIRGVEFDRVGNTQIVQNNIFVNNTGATGVTNVSVQGNGFAGFGGYTPNSSRQYVGATNPYAASVIFASGGNYFQSATEYPSGSWFIETPWASYTPTFSCGSGTVTTATTNGRYKNLGNKTIAVNFGVSITANNTCATFETLTLPATANVLAATGGRDNGTSLALSGSVAAGSVNFNFQKYDGTYAGTNTSVQEFNLVYETQ